MSRVGHFAHGPAHVQKKTVVVPQIQYIAVCDATTCSLNSECSETLEEDLQNAVQRWCGQCPCSDALASSHQKKGKPESLRKLCEEPDCMCSENCVVWAQTPIKIVSSPLPSFLLYFLFFCNTSSEKIRSRFFTFSLHFLKKILLLMFYFSLLKMFYS